MSAGRVGAVSLGALLWALAGWAWALADGDAQASGAATPADAPRGATTTLGPVELTVRLSPAAPRIGDPLQLELRARAAPDVELLMPEFGEVLDRFAILDFASSESLDPQGHTLAVQRYTLDVPRSGSHAIPPLLVEFVDRRPGQRAAPPGTDAYELQSQRLDFHVASVAPGSAVPALRPPLPPLATERPAARRRVWAAAVALLGAALAALYVWRRLRPRAPPHPYDVARARLDALLAAPRPGPDELDAFFVELSDLVRRYLEARFELRSPELTTEEFLTVARRSRALGPELRGLLAEFLRRADLVKFARHQPGDAEVQASLDAAGRVLEETRPVEAPGVPPTPPAQAEAARA